MAWVLSRVLDSLNRNWALVIEIRRYSDVSKSSRFHFPVMPSKKTFQGEVYFIDPRIDATSGLLRTRILIQNPDHEIRAGMRGKVVLP